MKQNKKIGWFSPSIDSVTISIDDNEKEFFDFPGEPDHINTPEFENWLHEKCIMEFNCNFDDVEWINE